MQVIAFACLFCPTVVSNPPFPESTPRSCTHRQSHSALSPSSTLSSLQTGTLGVQADAPVNTEIMLAPEKFWVFLTQLLLWVFLVGWWVLFCFFKCVRLANMLIE